MTLRQGQTIYVVALSDYINMRYEVQAYHLYSQKEPLPQEGEILTRLPVTLAKKKKKEVRMYHSRRKAITAMKRLNA